MSVVLFQMCCYNKEFSNLCDLRELKYNTLASHITCKGVLYLSNYCLL